MILFVSGYFISNAQTDFTDKLSGWKTAFPKEEVIAVSSKEVISFSLNPSPQGDEGKVKASVLTEQVLVPVKDYLKFEDGIFYNDEVSIDNVKASNSKNKDVPFQKNCMAYTDEDIFHSDSRLCVIKFPMEEKGKAFQYSYQENFRDVKYVTSLYFHDNLPAITRIIEFDIPSWLELDLKEFNFNGFAVQKSSVKEGDITKVTYQFNNVPAYKREPHSPNHAITFPHIICISKACTENGQRTVLFESVKDLYAWYRSICDKIGNQPEVMRGKVNELTSGKKTDIEKIESIYYWVQDNIRYIAFENGIMGFRPEAAQNVFKNKYGDCKGMANLLKEMLKLAGYDARLTWIGTSDLPYDYSMPSLAVDNHMICTVILNGKRYFLDGTENNIAFNDYAQRIQGKQVLIEDGKNYILDRIPDFSAERNKVKDNKKLSIDGTMLKGNAAAEFNGESKIILEDVYASIRNENKSEALSGFLKKDNDNVVVSNIKNPDFTDRQKPLPVSYDLTVNNEVTKAGNELYVVMDWDKDFGNLEFDDDRKNDYELNHKYYNVTQVELEIPSGYKVDYMPAAFSKKGDGYSFEGSYANKGKSIIYTKTIIINKAIIKKAEFAAWNDFIKGINTFYNDQVVLVAAK